MHVHTRPPPQIPPLFDREETRERLRKLPGGATQPLTVGAACCFHFGHVAASALVPA